jgi:hypothetical protein
MKVYIQVKKLGKRMQTVGSIPYELETCPATLRELIVCMVKQGVDGYNAQLRSGEQNKVLSETEIHDMSQVGKIAFGIPFGQKEADPAKAVDAALLAFTDGLYRFFVNEQEITELDAPLHLCEGDTIAIIRLVMLTGGLF